MLARRRRAAPLEAAMLAVIVRKLKVPKGFFYGLLGDLCERRCWVVEESNSACLRRLIKATRPQVKYTMEATYIAIIIVRHFHVCLQKEFLL